MKTLPILLCATLFAACAPEPGAENPGGETASALDTTAPDAPTITSPAQGETTGDAPTVAGTTEALATVKIFIDDVLAGTVVADGQGNWSFTLTTPLTDGAHTVSASATDQAGNLGPTSAAMGFTVESASGAAPVFGYRGGGCSAGASARTATTLTFGLLALLARRPRRRAVSMNR